MGADGPRRNERRGGRARSGGESRRKPEEGRPARRGGGTEGERGRSGGDSRRGRKGSGAPGQQERPADPAIDPEVTGYELADEVRSELGSLSGSLARIVSRHLVMAGSLLDDDPERAYQHAVAARRRAARLGVIREAAGIAAYAAGRYAEALSELRAARRITGSAEYLPMMADCERGLGRPSRALDLAADPAATGLEIAGRVEMLIVAAGARRDLGDLDGAITSLQVPELRARGREQWVARLRYAYADLLEAAGRTDEARHWFLRAAEADVEDETDAAERVSALDHPQGEPASGDESAAEGPDGPEGVAGQ